jgi:hypothetical protein
MVNPTGKYMLSWEIVFVVSSQFCQKLTHLLVNSPATTLADAGGGDVVPLCSRLPDKERPAGASPCVLLIGLALFSC